MKIRLLAIAPTSHPSASAASAAVRAATGSCRTPAAAAADAAARASCSVLRKAGSASFIRNSLP